MLKSSFQMVYDSHHNLVNNNRIPVSQTNTGKVPFVVATFRPFVLFMTCHRVFNKRNTKWDTSGSVYLFGSPEFFLSAVYRLFNL